MPGSDDDDTRKKPPPPDPDAPGDGTVRDLLGYLESNPDPEARKLARQLLKDRFRMVQDEIDLVRRRRDAQDEGERDAIDREIESRLGARVTREPPDEPEDG